MIPAATETCVSCEVKVDATTAGQQGLPPRPPDGNIARLLWDTAARAGAHPAVVESDATTDYETLCGRAGAVARALVERGAKPGDRVGIFLERGADAAAAFFGVTALGGIAVILNETLRPRQIEYILRHAGARALVASSDLLARQPRTVDTTATVLTTDRLPEVAPIAPLPRLGADVAQIVYTSGSTGQPKGVTLSHANLWAGTDAVATYLGLCGDDRVASLLPFSFDYGLNQLLGAVSRGATLIVERSTLPQRIAARLWERSVTVLAAVPPLWLQLLAVSAFRQGSYASLRAMTNTGGRLPVDAVRALRAAHPDARLFLMYGLTEAFRSTYLPPDEVDEHPDSIGRAIPGAQILVLRDDATPCEPGEVGELVHRGPTVALGYWNDAVSTARVFRPNPQRPPGTPASERVVFSGDLVRRDEEGRLYHVGRRDQMIKTLGYRVSPDEVAAALYASGQIVEAVITSETDAVRGARIVAHVVLAEGGSLSRLEAFCAAELPRYMQPCRIAVRGEIPRTATGKHDVRAMARG